MFLFFIKLQIGVQTSSQITIQIQFYYFYRKQSTHI